MKHFDEPQDVIRMLQSPATSTELEGQAAAVDMMVGAQVPPAAVRRGRRPYRLGALIAAGVIGFGSVAAAGPGGFDPFQLGPTPDEVDDDVVVGDTPVVEEQPDDVVVDVQDAGEDEQESTEDETEGADDPEPAAVVDPAVVEEEVVEEEVVEEEPVAAFPEDLCVDDAPHGATVSQVARGVLKDLEEYPEIGVVEAAQSDCGKKHAEGDEVEEVDSDVDEDVAEMPDVSDDAETNDEDQPKTERSGGEHPGKGNGGNSNGGNSNGGNGKGKGGRGD